MLLVANFIYAFIDSVISINKNLTTRNFCFLVFLFFIFLQQIYTISTIFCLSLLQLSVSVKYSGAVNVYVLWEGWFITFGIFFFAVL